MSDVVYKFKNAEQFGLFLIWCVENDISIWRTYWSEREKDRCYRIDWQDKRVYYGSEKYWLEKFYKVVETKFYFDEYGIIKMEQEV